MKKNLIYYICPFKSNNEWKNNVNELSKYIHQFNGKKIVTVAYGKGLLPFSDVKKAFNDKSIKFIRLKNSPELGEVKPFEKMLSEVYSKNSEEITFYAHAKGVSPKHCSNMRVRNSIAIWRNTSYYFCLKNTNYIYQLLSDYQSCGCLKYGPTNAVPRWHFCGTFFWFKHDAIFTRDDWGKVTQHRFGVEMYLGEKLDRKKSYTLFGERFKGKLLYRGWPRSWQCLLDPYGLKSEDFMN